MRAIARDLFAALREPALLHQACPKTRRSNPHVDIGALPARYLKLVHSNFARDARPNPTACPLFTAQSPHSSTHNVHNPKRIVARFRPERPLAAGALQKLQIIIY